MQNKRAGLSLAIIEISLLIFSLEATKRGRIVPRFERLLHQEETNKKEPANPSLLLEFFAI